MTTNIPGSTARQDPRNVSNTIRWRFNWNDPNIQVGVQIGVLPQNAFITLALMEIVTAFNSGTANSLTVGTVGAAYNNILTAANTISTGSPAAVGTGVAPIGAGVSQLGRSLTQAGDTPVFVKYAPTGTVPTTGIAEVLIEFEGGFPDH